MTSARNNLKISLVIPVLFAGVMWLVKIIETITDTSFAHYGLIPRKLEGLIGIVTTPFLHGDFEHLVSNTLPILILGFAILSAFPKFAFRVFGWIFFLTGFWVWVAARPSYHIGASGIIYGMISFLFFMGLIRRDARSIALALLVTFLYGSFIWGIFPIEQGISWESHLLGGIAGIFCAVLYRNEDRPPKPLILIEDQETDLPYSDYEVEGELKQEKYFPETQIRYIFKREEKKPPDSQ